MNPRLRNRSIFLSASIPSPDRRKEFSRVRDAHVLITESVIVLTRAVLSHGGHLVMGGHPTITPMIAQVAGEYLQPLTVEGQRLTTLPESKEPSNIQFTIYQSRVFEESVPAETLLLEQLGYARIVWTDVINNETFKPRKRPRVPPAPKSLLHMRERMLNDTEFAGMVCIGGMEGVIEEARLFAKFRPGVPIYAMETTGGAASLLRKTTGIAKIRALDIEILEEIEPLWSKFPVQSERDEEGSTDRNRQENTTSSRPPAETSPLPRDAIYPLVMQTVVEEIGDSREPNSELNR